MVNGAVTILCKPHGIQSKEEKSLKDKSMANNSAPCVLWSHLEHALESVVKYLMCVCEREQDESLLQTHP